MITLQEGTVVLLHALKGVNASEENEEVITRLNELFEGIERFLQDIDGVRKSFDPSTGYVKLKLDVEGLTEGTLDVAVDLLRDYGYVVKVITDSPHEPNGASIRYLAFAVPN